ncbi:hypothetical protein AK812_SmicGene36833 [Symbiodinium microadriaticum]|uniref:Uncharacterized protein n=1 Tax=Symbiodinium microadriaticum TaxID=2951 RepID=A0A1Q9CHV1_SYMMI|nr:hypothetical protein AK812_SmicGene36833 [Symbiodinium microadriaticum]
MVGEDIAAVPGGYRQDDDEDDDDHNAAQAPEELPIDDFSDYEDDAHARRSSLADLEEQDWSKVSKGVRPAEGASPEEV